MGRSSLKQRGTRHPLNRNMFSRSTVIKTAAGDVRMTVPIRVTSIAGTALETEGPVGVLRLALQRAEQRPTPAADVRLQSRSRPRRRRQRRAARDRERPAPRSPEPGTKARRVESPPRQRGGVSPREGAGSLTHRVSLSATVSPSPAWGGRARVDEPIGAAPAAAASRRAAPPPPAPPPGLPPLDQELPPPPPPRQEEQRLDQFNKTKTPHCIATAFSYYLNFPP